MRRHSIIREFSATLVLLVLVTAAMAQTVPSGKPGTSPTPATSQPEAAAASAAVDKLSTDQPAADKLQSDKLSSPKPPSVPLIGVGDLLKVSVLGAPESDQELRVSADGNLFLNFVGAVHVAGLTTEEAQALIAKKMAAGGFFTDPQVAVFAKEYATQGVSVMGEVQKPGVYPLLGSRTLFDVLSLAGGTTSKAGKKVSITHRNNPEAPTLVTLSNDEGDSDRSNNVDVYPGDTIVVSRAGLIYVVGDVKRPSGVLMENGKPMTVLQAIAMAEGVNPTAAMNSGKIIRKTPNGPQEIPLLLKKILSAKSPDIQLQAEDIIFIPASAGKTATKRSVDAIIQIATGLAFRPY